MAIGACLGWLASRMKARNDAMPIIRVEWYQGELGRAAVVEIVNRLNEDLIFTSVQASTRMGDLTYETDERGNVVSHSFALKDSKVDLAWKIAPNASGSEKFYIQSDDKPCWLRLTVSSSNRTLRNKRVLLRPAKSLASP